MENNIKLSVLEIENKYKVNFDEDFDSKTNSYIRWGADNNLPILYKTCYNQSATLKSIIDGMVNFIVGDKIVVGDGSAFWRERVNRNNMTMRQFIAKLAHSYLVYGGFAIQVIYNKIGYVTEMYPLEFSRCRTNEYGTKIYYSKKWNKYQAKYEEYDAFNPERVDMEKATQIFYYKGDLTTTVYPLPPYAGAVYDVLTEIECSKYSLNTVARGFSAKHIINFPEQNNLTDEQKRGIEDAIKNKFCGSDNEVNFMLYWMDGENQGIDVKKIESDETPERYIAIKDNARQNIFVSMRATPNLFGLPTATTGFNSQEYNDAFKLFYKGVINPIQDIIYEALFKITNTSDIKILPYSIDFNNDTQTEE